MHLNFSCSIDVLRQPQQQPVFNFGFRNKWVAEEEEAAEEEEEKEQPRTSFPVCARRWREIPAWRCSPNRICPWTERPSRASSASSRPCRRNWTRPSEYSTEMTFTRSTGKTPCSPRRKFSRQTASSSTWAQVVMSAVLAEGNAAPSQSGLT